jgi:hypothetical protein
MLKLLLLLLAATINAIDFIVVFKESSVHVASTKSKITAFGGKIKHELKLINGIAVHMPAHLSMDEAAEWLDTLPGVSYVELDGEVHI